MPNHYENLINRHIKNQQSGEHDGWVLDSEALFAAMQPGAGPIRIADLYRKEQTDDDED